MCQALKQTPLIPVCTQNTSTKSVEFVHHTSQQIAFTQETSSSNKESVEALRHTSQQIPGCTVSSNKDTVEAVHHTSQNIPESTVFTQATSADAITAVPQALVRLRMPAPAMDKQKSVSSQDQPTGRRNSQAISRLMTSQNCGCCTIL